jgi:hypothetical protein
MPNFLLDKGIVLSVVVLWSLVWKGIALWKAVKAGSKPWYIAILVVNTLGILEILYIFVFSRMGKKGMKMKGKKAVNSKKNA